MYVQVDAAQLEWRTLAWLADDPIAIEEINDRDANPDDPEKDIHEKNRRVLLLPERLIAKTFLFRTIYRGSGWAFANDANFAHVSTDPDYWDDLNAKFFAKYKGIDQCHTRWAQCVAQRKPIVSPLGNEWLIPLKPDGRIPWTTLTNHPVQGTGADIVLVGRVTMRSRLLAANSKSLAVNTVHDSIVYDCPTKEEVIKTGKIAIDSFRDVSKNISRIWGIKVPILFPGEVKVGPTLSEKDMVSLTEFIAEG